MRIIHLIARSCWTEHFSLLMYHYLIFFFLIIIHLLFISLNKSLPQLMTSVLWYYVFQKKCHLNGHLILNINWPFDIKSQMALIFWNEPNCFWWSGEFNVGAIRFLQKAGEKYFIIFVSKWISNSNENFIWWIRF